VPNSDINQAHSIHVVGTKPYAGNYFMGAIGRQITGRPAMQDNDHNPHHHTKKMAQRLEETIEHLRKDIEKVEEPQFKAMFETSAEVLGGLVKAFHDYDQKNESAWRRKHAA
jgi:hypothetical protein